MKNLKLKDYYKRQERLEAIARLKLLFLMLTVLILAFLFFRGMAKAVDSGISRQDEMLCESAKKSGNAQYLKKCQCYYKSENIKCLTK